jgi:hypothetical protein
MPAIPARLNGARDDRFLRRQSGKRTVTVNPIKDACLPTFNPTVVKSALNVSPST